MKIVLATSNRGKVAELQSLLPKHVTIVTSGELGIRLPAETGTDFVENALVKARAAAGSQYIAIADDSGLNVEALGGAPGIFSARFAGENATDDQNNSKLVELLAGLDRRERAARFCSAVAFVTPDGREFCATGSVSGVILEEPRGWNGFGYDPLFEIDDPTTPEFNGRTMAEITVEEKNSISHRARAYRNLMQQLKPIGLLEPACAGNGKSGVHGVGR